MFATLLGPLPRPPLPADADPRALLDAVLALQTEHGLEPLTDGGWPTDGDPVVAWTTTAERAGDRLVKAVVLGPITSERTTSDVRRTVLDLAAAGCAWIEVHERAADLLGTDPSALSAFADAHRALTADLAGVHLSLAITGGSVDRSSFEAIVAAGYASLALDLIGGPDNWRLAAAASADQGVICGALATRRGSDDGPEPLLWAAGYAASMRGRGPDRVGLATAGSLAHLPWDVAVAKVERLGHAARLAAAPAAERNVRIDPRAVDIRSAALGRYAPGGFRQLAKARKTRPPGT